MLIWFLFVASVFWFLFNCSCDLWQIVLLFVLSQIMLSRSCPTIALAVALAVAVAKCVELYVAWSGRLAKYAQIFMYKRGQRAEWLAREECTEGTVYHSARGGVAWGRVASRWATPGLKFLPFAICLAILVPRQSRSYLPACFLTFSFSFSFHSPSSVVPPLLFFLFLCVSYDVVGDTARGCTWLSRPGHEACALLMRL